MQKSSNMTNSRCVARDTGVPIFGLETNMTAAKDMTCACASQVFTALRWFQYYLRMVDWRWLHSCQVWELRAQGCAMLVNFDGSGEKSGARLVVGLMRLSWLIIGRKFKLRFKEDYEKCLRDQEKYFPNHLRCHITAEFTSQNLHRCIFWHYPGVSPTGTLTQPSALSRWYRIEEL